MELEKCCQTHIFLKKFVLIQPRTSPPKIAKFCNFFLQNWATRGGRGPAPGPHLEVPGPPRVSPFASIRQPTFAIAATVEPDAYFGSDNTICFGDITTKKIKHEYDTSWVLRNATALSNLILKENEIKTQELIFQGSQLVNRVGASDSAGRQRTNCREVSLLASTDTVRLKTDP